MPELVYAEVRCLPLPQLGIAMEVFGELSQRRCPSRGAELSLKSETCIILNDQLSTLLHLYRLDHLLCVLNISHVSILFPFVAK